MKRNLHKIPLIIGLIILGIGVGCFVDIFLFKDAIYKHYWIRFSDQQVQEIFMNDLGEGEIREKFNAAIHENTHETVFVKFSESEQAEIADIYAQEKAELGLVENTQKKVVEVIELPEDKIEFESETEDLIQKRKERDPYDIIFSRGFSRVQSLRMSYRLERICLVLGAGLAAGGLIFGFFSTIAEFIEKRRSLR